MQVINVCVYVQPDAMTVWFWILFLTPQYHSQFDENIRLIARRYDQSGSEPVDTQPVECRSLKPGTPEPDGDSNQERAKDRGVGRLWRDTYWLCSSITIPCWVFLKIISQKKHTVTSSVMFAVNWEAWTSLTTTEEKDTHLRTSDQICNFSFRSTRGRSDFISCHIGQQQQWRNGGGAAGEGGV